MELVTFQWRVYIKLTILQKKPTPTQKLSGVPVTFQMSDLSSPPLEEETQRRDE